MSTTPEISRAGESPRFGEIALPERPVGLITVDMLPLCFARPDEYSWLPGYIELFGKVCATSEISPLGENPDTQVGTYLKVGLRNVCLNHYIDERHGFRDEVWSLLYRDVRIQEEFKQSLNVIRIPEGHYFIEEHNFRYYRGKVVEPAMVRPLSVRGDKFRQRVMPSMERLLEVA